MIKIKHFFIFAVITIANSKLLEDPEPGRNELEKLLQELQGKFNIKAENEHHSHDHEHVHHDGHHHIGHHKANHDKPSLTNIQTLNMYYRKHPKGTDETSDAEDTPRYIQRTDDNTASNIDNRCGKFSNCKPLRGGTADEVVQLLDELEHDLEHNANDDRRDDLRCRGNRCGRGRREREDRPDDGSDPSNLRCRGNRCGRGRDGKDSRDDDKDQLRCRGNRCGRGRDGRDNDRDDNDRDPLRCRGNRCGRGRDGRDNERDDADRDPLRCRGNRCGRGRDGRDNDRDDNDRDPLRCRGNRCGRGRDGRDNDLDDANRDPLRCRGNRCGRGRNGRDSDRDDDDDNDTLRCRGRVCQRGQLENLESLEERDENRNDDKRIKKYKISDDLDAIVLDVPDVDNLLKKLGVPKTTNLDDVKVLKNVDLGSLFGNRKSSEEKDNVEAVVIDMSEIQDGDILAKKLKNLASLNAEKLYSTNTDSKKNEVSKHISNLFSQNQKRLMEVDKLVSGNRDVDTKMSYNKKESKILPHNEDNNNVYIPKWLHNSVLTNSKLRNADDGNRAQKAELKQPMITPVKSMFPLTQKQKDRLLASLQNNQKRWRRSVERDVGVPFELQVQGLGQINP